MFVCEFCILETCYNCLLVSGVLMSFLRFSTNHAISKWRPFKIFPSPICVPSIPFVLVNSLGLQSDVKSESLSYC